MNEFGFHSKSIEASPLGVEYSTAAMPLRSLRSGTLISLAGLNCDLVLTSSTCGASTRERQPGAEIRLPEATLWAGIALRVDHAIQDLAANNRGPMPVLKISIYV